MSDEHAMRLREVLNGLYGEAGRIERAGRLLSGAELRRAASLRAAAGHVQEAIDELHGGSDESPAVPASREASGSGEAAAVEGPAYGEAAAADEPAYGEAAAAEEPPPAEAGAADHGALREMMELEFGLHGDDDTPGYGWDDDDTPGYGRGGGGLAGA